MRVHFRRPPNWKALALTFESAFRVMDRKGLWMVEYLRGRRSGDKLTGFYRRRFIAERNGRTPHA